jgi:hypothetical protein
MHSGVNYLNYGRLVPPRSDAGCNGLYSLNAPPTTRRQAAADQSRDGSPQSKELTLAAKNLVTLTMIARGKQPTPPSLPHAFAQDGRRASVSQTPHQS